MDVSFHACPGRDFPDRRHWELRAPYLAEQPIGAAVPDILRDRREFDRRNRNGSSGAAGAVI
jgi:hypothetical protein